MSDLTLADRLQLALGDAYRVERELAVGGMSHLFLAQERSLDREVVVKVLSPELTSEVSSARFRQEIDLVAHLHHPHILSVLASGAKGDLLFYIMPYVSGESLRHRLASSGRLPIADAVRILREISDALAYAHRKGIVHRDIKPENILLQEGHALLADFGVARAIDAAREVKLTGTGTSVGTPAYMAPEQAAAECNIDARADLYALGVVGYEMLTGELPFSGPSAQSVLVAQLTAPPPPTVHLRSDTPPGVNAAIARSLAKAPADRFGTAEDFRDALDVTIAPTSPRMGWRALVGAGLAALAAVGIAAALRSNRHALVPEALDADLIAVAPFDVTDTTLKLWHEGMVDVLSRNLDGAGSLRTVSPSVVISRWSGRADPISAVALGRSTGARLAIIGSLIPSGPDSVRAAVSLIDVSSGRTLGDAIDRRDATSRIDQLLDTLSISLLRALARSRLTAPRQRSSLGTSSLPALKDFLQGEQLYRQSHFDSALVFFQRAVAIDSTFALAFKRASDAIVWGARDPDGRGAGYATRALRYNHGLSPRDSILIALISPDADQTSPSTPDREFAALRDGFAALHADVARYPNDLEMWFELGDWQFHNAFGPVIGVPEREVLRSFDRAIALDSGFTPLYAHPVKMGFHYGRITGRRYLSAYISHSPGGSPAGARLADALTDPHRASLPEVARWLDSASVAELDGASDLLEEYGDAAESAMRLTHATQRALARPGSHETEADLSVELSRAFAVHGRVQEALAAHPSWVVVIDLVLIGAISPTLGDSLIDADSTRNSDDFDIAYLGIRGDSARLRRAMLHVDSLRTGKDGPSVREVQPYLIAVANGYGALIRHDTATAMRVLLTVPDSLCHECTRVWLTQVQLLEASGRYAEAARILDQHEHHFDPLRPYIELKRGLLAEKLGDRARAVDAYSFVLDMWQHADTPLQQYVAEARAGLRRLGRERDGTNVPGDDGVPLHNP